ncbi:MAG: hypothetical protein CBC16_00725, partial [Verrucomicrobia bacterium TMED56]
SYNGEIFNYLELIKKYKLQNLKTKSDTEVLLKLININNNLPNKDLDGMWSYAYLNKKQKKLTICRDWFGEKPLYYIYKNKCLFYGSSINYINTLSGRNKEINEEKIATFLSYGFKSISSDTQTFDEKVAVLESSTALSIDHSLKPKKIKIWNKKPEKKMISNKYNENVIFLRDLLKTSFSRRLRSDFPVACLLSGGIDSTAIAGYTKKFFNEKLSCYSIFNKEKSYDESKQINSFCETYGVQPKYIRMNALDNYKFLEKIIEENNCPLSSISYLAYANLNKAARDDGHRVLLSGLGGDEMFAGYYLHHMCYLVSTQKDKRFQKFYNEWEKFTKPLIRTKILSNFNYFKSQLKKENYSFHEKSEIKKYLKSKKLPQISTKKYSKNFFRNQLSIDLFEHTVPAHNISADQISMHFSIENRNPFLSKDIFNFSNSLPDHYLIKDGFGKRILRDALNKIVPESILKFREKIGFYANLREFFDIKNKKFKDKLYQSESVNKYLDKNSIDKILKKNHLNNIESKFIFNILNLAILTKLN